MFRISETNLRRKYGLLTEEDEEDLVNEKVIPGRRARRMTVLERPTGVGARKFNPSLSSTVNSFESHIVGEYTNEFHAFLVKVKTRPELKNLIKEDKKWLKLVKGGGMEQSFKAKICTDHFAKIFKNNEYPIKTFLSKFVKYIRGIVRYMCDTLFAKIDKFMKDYYEIPDKIIGAIVKLYNDNFQKGLEKYQFPLGEMKSLIGGYLYKANGRDVIRLLKTHRCSDKDQMKLLEIREVYCLRRLPLIDPNLALPYVITPYEKAIKILGGIGKSFNLDIYNLMSILEKAYESMWEDIDRNLGENAAVNDTDLSIVIAYCIINCDVHKIPAWLEYVRAHIPKNVKKEHEEKKMVSLLFCFVMKWFMEHIKFKVDRTAVKKVKEVVTEPVSASITPISLMSRRVVKKGNKTNNQQVAPASQVVKMGSRNIKPGRAAPPKPAGEKVPATEPKVVKIGGVRTNKPGRAAPVKPPGKNEEEERKKKELEEKMKREAEEKKKREEEEKKKKEEEEEKRLEAERKRKEEEERKRILEEKKKKEEEEERKRKEEEEKRKKKEEEEEKKKKEEEEKKKKAAKPLKPTRPKAKRPAPRVPKKEKVVEEVPEEDEFPLEEEILEEEDLEEEVSVSLPEESTEVITKTVSMDEINLAGKGDELPEEEEFEEEELPEEDPSGGKTKPTRPTRPGRPTGRPTSSKPVRPGRPGRKPAAKPSQKPTRPSVRTKRKSGGQAVEKSSTPPPKPEREKKAESPTTTKIAPVKPAKKPTKPASKPGTKPVKKASKPASKPGTKPNTKPNKPAPKPTNKPLKRPGRPRPRSGRLSVDLKRPARPKSVARPRSALGIKNVSSSVPESTPPSKPSTPPTPPTSTTTTTEKKDNPTVSTKKKKTPNSPSSPVPSGDKAPPKPSRPPKPGAPPSKPRNINPADRTKRLSQARRRSLVFRQKLALGNLKRSESLGPAKKPPPVKKPSVPSPLSPTPSSEKKQPPSIPRTKKRVSGNMDAEEKKELIVALKKVKESIGSGRNISFEYNGPRSQIADLCKEIIVDMLGKKLKNTK